MTATTASVSAAPVSSRHRQRADVGPSERNELVATRSIAIILSASPGHHGRRRLRLTNSHPLGRLVQVDCSHGWRSRFLPTVEPPERSAHDRVANTDEAGAPSADFGREQ
jgi:hypothetical protein